MSQFNDSDGDDNRKWRLPVIRLNIQEVRGFVVVTTHENAKWILDHIGRHLPGVFDAFTLREIAIWAWSHEVWWGGVVGLGQTLGPHLDIEMVDLHVEIAWSHLSGLEGEGAYLQRVLAKLDNDLNDMKNVTIVQVVTEMQEVIRHLSTFKLPVWGVVLISLPEGYRCELVGHNFALGMYIEQDLVFPSLKKEISKEIVKTEEDDTTVKDSRPENDDNLEPSV